MRPEEADAAVRAVITAVAPDIDPASITADTHLLDDIDLDSVDYLNVVIGIHEQHGIEIPERDYESLHRFGDMVAYLSRPA